MRQAGIWQQAFGFAEGIAVNLPSRVFERGNLLEERDLAGPHPQVWTKIDADAEVCHGIRSFVTS